MSDATVGLARWTEWVALLLETMNYLAVAVAVTATATAWHACQWSEEKRRMLEANHGEET